METKLSKWRKELLKEARGKILEVGIGTGKNIPYYQDDVELTGIDFSERMIEITQKKSKDKSNVRLQVMDVENMEFEDNSFDTIVTSCVYCSVPNPVKGLMEMKRVCKPGGKIWMLEHIRSHHKVAGKIMDILNPIPLYIYGANINRQAYANPLKAGFNPDQITVKQLWFDIVKIISISK